MKRVVLTTLAFVFFSLGAATTAVAQEEAVAQQGTISQSFLLAVRLRNVVQFEEAYLRHVEWHRRQGDTWTWDMWSTVTSDLGTYIVITGGHTWADFDVPPVDPVADGADATAQFGSLVESVTGGFMRSMTTVSRPAAGRMPLALVTDFEVKEGMDGDFLQVVRKFNEAAEQVDWTEHYVWLASVGGSRGDYILVLQRENWASFAPHEMSAEAVMEEAFGRQEANALWDMFFNAVESTSERIWTYRPDLSYTPGN